MSTMQALKQGVKGEVLLRTHYLEGLSKETPDLSRTPHVLYDKRGVYLFDRIRKLNSYYIPRLEAQVLDACADTIVDVCAQYSISWLVDMGAGRVPRLPILFDAYQRRQYPLAVHLCDVDGEAIIGAKLQLQPRYDGKLSFHVHPWSHDQVLSWLPQKAKNSGRGLVCQLGHNFGNYWPDQALGFLQKVQKGLKEGGCLLVGVDCIPNRHKPLHEILNAYRGPATEQFIANALQRLVSLGAEADPSSFLYRCEYDKVSNSVVMELEAWRSTVICLDGQQFHFEPDQRLIVERSYRYSPELLRALAIKAGFKLSKIRIFQDEKQRYMLALLEK